MEIYDALTQGSAAEDAPFRTFKDVFMLAVVLGYRSERRLPAPTSAKRTIRREVFTDNDYYLLKAIAIASTGDVNVLMNQANVLTIAEEYAQAGIHEVKSELLEQPGRPLWSLVSISNQSQS
jgi:dnd system-associated protein 4